MDIIILNGKYLIKECPLEACIGNMVRRILQIIREEYSAFRSKRISVDLTDQESLYGISTTESDRVDFSESIYYMPDFQSALIEHINEFETELETWLVVTSAS